MDSTKFCEEKTCPYFPVHSCKDCDPKKRPVCGRPCNEYIFEQSVSDVIDSVALVGTAMAHILNAEGEKIQKAVQVSKDINELLEVNRSVNKVIVYAMQLEQAYCQKLDAVNELYRMGCERSHKENRPDDCSEQEPCRPYQPCLPQRFCKPYCSEGMCPDYPCAELERRSCPPVCLRYAKKSGGEPEYCSFFEKNPCGEPENRPCPPVYPWGEKETHPYIPRNPYNEPENRPCSPVCPDSGIACSQCPMKHICIRPDQPPCPPPYPGGEGGYRPCPPPYPGGEGGYRPCPPPYPGGEGGHQPCPPPYPGGEGGYQPCPPPYPGGEGGYQPCPPPYPGDEGGYQPCPPPHPEGGAGPPPRPPTYPDDGVGCFTEYPEGETRVSPCSTEHSGGDGRNPPVFAVQSGDEMRNPVISLPSSDGEPGPPSGSLVYYDIGAASLPYASADVGSEEEYHPHATVFQDPGAGKNSLFGNQDFGPQTNRSIFLAAAEYSWSGGTAMMLRSDSGCGGNITLHHGRIDSSILLPAGKKLKIEYEIDLINKYSRTVIIDMRLYRNNEVLKTRNLFGGTYRYRLSSSDAFLLEMPDGQETYTLSIWLLSGPNLKVVSGRIIITEI